MTGGTDARGKTTSFTFDARDRKISMTDRLSGVTSWSYDPNGNLLTLTDPDNQDDAEADHMDLRPAKPKASEAYPDSSTARWAGRLRCRQFSYDAIGRPNIFMDQNGDSVTHSFDTADRLLVAAYRLSGSGTGGTAPISTPSPTTMPAGRSRPPAAGIAISSRLPTATPLAD